MTDFAKRLELHNQTAELDALRQEGRGMMWANERAMLSGERPPHDKQAFDELAAKIRATKVQIDDAVLLERLRG